MPEGHTVHRLARAHRRRFGGRVVRVSSPQGRFAAGAALVDGRVLRRVDVHGKHLFHDYRAGLVVHVHLGLYGTFTEHTGPVTAPVGAVRMRLVTDGYWCDLRGPTRCELITPAEARAVRAALGPDPLRRDADPVRSWERIRRSRAPLATLLLDQQVLAGVGNVYRAEILFRHRLDPQLPGREVTANRWDALWGDLVTLMRQGARRGRIDTVRPEHERPHRAIGGLGQVYVYRRAGEPCLVCGTPIRTAEHGARKLYWCPGCQTGR